MEERRGDVDNIEQDDEFIGEWDLRPLTPRYQESHHSPYVEALNACLKNRNIHNIALAGGYGVGKSSILSRFADEHERDVVRVSLLTLTPVDKSQIDDSVPKQATTKTNLIQQEIVKQLLYSAEPKDMPQSRFRRIGKPSRLREAIIAAYCGVVFLGIMFITGWFGKIGSAVSSTFKMDWNPVANVVVSLLVGVVLALVLIELSRGRVHLRQLSAGPATVTLDEESVSFFDQYLDEIVYFFERSRHTIVIFEDLDRFDDFHIFETLRALNLLLNSPRKRLRKPIRFIYALKDSVFDEASLPKAKPSGAKEGTEAKNIPEAEGTEKTESIRANRTKFFDIVIPVVPFISHTTAGSLILKLLERSESRVSPWIADVAGRYVTDMRLLKNICNEFIVFHDRLNAGDGVDVKYEADQIFAMMLYKNTRIRQFELMKTGESDMDSLYADYRRLVSRNISVLQQKNRELVQQQTDLTLTSERSAKYGAALRAFFQREMKSLNSANSSYSINLQNRSFSLADFDKQSFWTAAAESSEQDIFTINIRDRNGYSHTARFTKVDLADITGAPLQLDAWNVERLGSIEEAIHHNLGQIKILRSATMSDLFEYQNFTLPPESRGSSATETNHEGGHGESFEAITKRHLGGGLAFELVRRGALTRDYAIYAQTFYGNRVSAAATNFIHHQVGPNEMDAQLPLTDRDVQDILRESTGGDLGERAYYNACILDYILGPGYKENTMDASGNRVETGRLITAIADLGDDERSFLQSYFESGRNTAKDTLLVLLLERNPGVLGYFISGIDLSDDDRRHWVSLALENISAQQEYLIDDTAATYLCDRFGGLEVLHKTDMSQDTVTSISGILQKAGASAEGLGQFSAPFIDEFISRSMYEINRMNLTVITGSEDISLNSLKSLEKDTAYNHILSHLDEYLTTLSTDDHSVTAPGSFVGILNDIARQGRYDEGILDRIVKLATEDCRITELSTVDANVWNPLVEYSRVPPSYANVAAFTIDSDTISQDMANLLAGERTISDIPDNEESMQGREMLAERILNSPDTLPDIDLRIDLVESLDLGEQLDVDHIGIQADELFAKLIGHHLIADDETTFLKIVQAGWPAMEPAIASSTGFVDFMSPEVLPPAMLSRLFSSTRVPDAVRERVLKEIVDYAKDADAPTMEDAIRYALSKDHAFADEGLRLFIDAHVDVALVVDALGPSCESMGISRVETILSMLPDEYASLTVAGRDHPKLSDTRGNLILLEYLKKHGKVTSFTTKGNMIRVNKHYPSQ